MNIFRNRVDAGRQLVRKLRAYHERDNTIVLALPRGGVPVAVQIARTLKLPLDVWVVRKLGAPDQPELALGAIAAGKRKVLGVMQKDSKKYAATGGRDLRVSWVIVKRGVRSALTLQQRALVATSRRSRAVMCSARIGNDCKATRR